MITTARYGSVGKLPVMSSCHQSHTNITRCELEPTSIILIRLNEYEKSLPILHKMHDDLTQESLMTRQRMWTITTEINFWIGMSSVWPKMSGTSRIPSSASIVARKGDQRTVLLFFFGGGGGGAGQGGKGVPGPALTTDMDYGLWMNVDNVDLVLFFF